MSDQWTTYTIALVIAVLSVRVFLGMLWAYCMLRRWIGRKLGIEREPDLFRAYVEWYGRHFA